MIHIYQRSGDMFLGVPFNIASYSLMCLFIAHLTDHEPGYLNHIIGDAHIYHNHIDQVSEQQSRHIINNDVYFEITPHIEILDEVVLPHLFLDFAQALPTFTLLEQSDERTII